MAGVRITVENCCATLWQQKALKYTEIILLLTDCFPAKDIDGVFLSKTWSAYIHPMDPVGFAVIYGAALCSRVPDRRLLHGEHCALAKHNVTASTFIDLYIRSHNGNWLCKLYGEIYHNCCKRNIKE